MIYFNYVTFTILMVLIVMKFQTCKCLVEISHKVVPSNLEPSDGSRKIYIISHGLEQRKIEKILQKDKFKALLTNSQRVKNIHLNSSTNVDNLDDVIHNTHEEREILHKLSPQLGLDVIGHDNILRDLKHHEKESSSIEVTEEEENKILNSFKKFKKDAVKISNETFSILNNDPNYGHLTKNILRFGGSCSKGASASCIKACKKALSNVCYEFKCSVDLKSRFSIECTRKCDKRFGTD